MIIKLDLPDNIISNFAKQLGGDDLENEVDFTTQKLLIFILYNAREFEVAKSLELFQKSTTDIRKSKEAQLDQLWVIQGDKIIDQGDK